MKFRKAIIIFALLALCCGCGKSDQSGTMYKTESQANDMFTERDLSADIPEYAQSIDLSSLSGRTYTIDKEGVYVLRGSYEGTLVVEVESSDKVQLVLGGCEINAKGGAAIYGKKAEKIFITAAPGTANTLSSTGVFVQQDSNNVDAAVFSKCDLTINGKGSISVTSGEGHGIVSKDDLVLAVSMLSVEADKKGIDANDSVRIHSGNITVNSGKTALHCEHDSEDRGFVYILDGVLTLNSEGDCINASGDVTILGGDLTMTAGDDGIHSDRGLLISGGNVKILDSYEGLEGMNVTISGGSVDVNALDDGINAAGGSDTDNSREKDGFRGTKGASITVSGGYVHVSARGDGIDSNDSITITGGELYIDGPSDDANAPIDHETETVISGGRVAAVGSIGMQSAMSESSGQCSMVLSCKGAAGDTVTLTDENGTVLLTHTAQKSFDCVVMSCPELEVGKTYTVYCGSASRTVTPDRVAYSESRFGGMPGGPGEMPGGRPGDMPGRP